MNNLNTNPNVAEYDDVYQAIIDMHKGLSEAESHKANAKLILTLANHIGDAGVVAEATDLARRSTLEWREE